MPRKSKQYHFIYKTTNKLNGKYYVGMHSTDDLQDGYIGSGKRLWYAVRKYGKENFETQVLEFYVDRSALKLSERLIVNEDMLKDPQCMNLTLGGESGFDNIKRKRLEDAEYDVQWKKMQSDRLKEAHADNKIAYDTFTGKYHTSDTKQKMSAAAEKRVGQANSQFGTCWIHNDTLQAVKKIKLNELDAFLASGWLKGRKLGR